MIGVTRTAVARAAPGGDEDGFAALSRVLEDLDRVVVAFSGGSDSAFLAWVAHDLLGPSRVLCVTAISPSLAPEEREDCRSLASEWGLRWRAIVTDELDDPAYVANGPDRCARCKHALMGALEPVAVAEGATVVLGVNVDDLGDYRPGQQVAATRGARFPLAEAGLTKSDVRSWSHRLGLRTWDKPAAACLASRLPYGTPVTLGALGSVARAESALRRLGFTQVRVRHHGPTARVEVPEEQLADVLARRADVVTAVRSSGYAFVALDLDGFRSGSMNRMLVPGASTVPGATTVSGAIEEGGGRA